VEKLYSETADKGLVLLSIDEDEDVETVSKFLAKLGPEFADLAAARKTLSMAMQRSQPFQSVSVEGHFLRNDWLAWWERYSALRDCSECWIGNRIVLWSRRRGSNHSPLIGAYLLYLRAHHLYGR
jgi:hypothetical protein